MLAIFLLLLDPPAAYPPEPPAPYVTPVRDYSACLRAVRAGQRVTLAVGVTDPADYRTPSLTGISPGVYECFPQDDQPVMRRRSVSSPPPALRFTIPTAGST